jgi:hypothetical protein
MSMVQGGVESLVDCGGGGLESFAKPSDGLIVQFRLLFLDMNFFRRATCVFLVLSGVALGQRIEDPNIDDYVPVVEDDLVVYTPKQAVRLGFRVLTGAGTTFSGQGSVESNGLNLDNPLTDNVDRGYHDGYVFRDQRTMTDPSGVQVPITPDGRTNNWRFSNEEQGATEGFIMMNSYKATVTDTGLRDDDPDAAFGIELSVDRDFGNLFNTRIKWGVVAGMGINQILSSTRSTVTASVTRTTDYYSLDGQAPPEAPYTAPQTSGGVDISVLLRSNPLWREQFESTTSADFENHWRLRGAFMTFRAGPVLQIPITEKLSATVSAGAVVVYAGSSYEVTQTFSPETGEDLALFITDTSSFIMPGFYVDANLQYSFTDTAGLYLGAVYQASGDYEQVVTSDDGTSRYISRVDLNKLQGIRAGMTFRF